MTINNKKSAPVKFDSARHYPIGHKGLRGRTWEIKKDRNTGEPVLQDGMPVKIFIDIEVPACPSIINDSLFLSRLRSDADQAEWVTK